VQGNLIVIADLRDHIQCHPGEERCQLHVILGIGGGRAGVGIGLDVGDKKLVGTDFDHRLLVIHG